MREKIRLMSSAGTGHYYTTTKNRRLHPEKMEVIEIRPRRPQARPVQGNQDQVAAASSVAVRSKEKPAFRRVFCLRGGKLRLRQRGLAHRAERLQVRHEFLEPLDAALLGARAPLAKVREQALVARVRAFPELLQLAAELRARS